MLLPPRLTCRAAAASLACCLLSLSVWHRQRGGVRLQVHPRAGLLWGGADIFEGALVAGAPSGGQSEAAYTRCCPMMPPEGCSNPNCQPLQVAHGPAWQLVLASCQSTAKVCICCQPVDDNLRMQGGETRLCTVPRAITLSQLVAKLRELTG